MSKSEGQSMTHKGCPNFEWVPNEPISDYLDEYLDSDYPIIDVLNKTELFEELDDKESAQEIN